MTTSPSFVIVGAGIAGAKAAQALSAIATLRPGEQIGDDVP